ncbi:MAG: zinc-ribbon domain-containing protein [Halobacterium sp.]
MSYCPNCGAELGADANFCEACGADVADVGGAAGGQPDTGRRTDQAAADRPPEPATRPSPRAAGAGGGLSRRSLLALGGVAAAGGWYAFLRDGAPAATNALSGGDPAPPLDRMNVEFVDVRKPDLGVTSATLPFLLAFSNPADRPIPDISGDFDVYLNDTRIGSDELTVNKLEPGEETNVDLEVVVEYANYGSALLDALESGSFTVEIRGSVNAGGASRTLTVTSSA